MGVCVHRDSTTTSVYRSTSRLGQGERAMADGRPEVERGGSSRSARVPPHNLQAEESLLGAMLLSKDAIASAVETVGIEDFYKPAHGHIFDAITSLYGAGEPSDSVT